MQIAIIENIREICEKIYSSQLQKHKAENIVERLVENKEKQEQIFDKKNSKKIEKDVFKNMKYSFIEYMSYILKRYGKKGIGYLNILEETVEMSGTTIGDVIKKEHFDIAVRKISIGKAITSIKKIQKMNCLEIFEKINGVEELLRKDPIRIYGKMDSKTKEYYRNTVKEISKRTKISEIYIAKKTYELAKENQNKNEEKKSHIGYYLIDEGIEELYKKLKYKAKRKKSEKSKAKIYLLSISFFSVLISVLMGICINIKTNSLITSIIGFLIFLIPSSEIVIQIMQYILSKTIKPKLIPKMNFEQGIDEKNKTMVVIPTIIKTKEKVEELVRKIEVFYLANKSKNIYFTILGDCQESNLKEEKYDIEVIEKAEELIEKLNKKYKDEYENQNNNENKKETSQIPIFSYIYRQRKWNEKEAKYIGWERKRGLLTQFNEYLLGNIKNPFRANTFEEVEEDKKEKLKEELKQIKYIITLDSDTDLVLNTGFELIGAMAHILNKPQIDKENKTIEKGYGIIQPRVGINLNSSNKSIFTKIFAGSGGIDAYTNAISDIYQDNFSEGIFTGKGIYDLKIYSKILKDQIPRNTVLSHDLLEGCYLRCGLASDIVLMDGYPSKYASYINRLSRWIRGDWQITKWMMPSSKLNLISKHKIFDNLRRSMFEISILIGMIYSMVINIIYKKQINIGIILALILIFPYILETVNRLILKKEGEENQKTFTPKITKTKGNIIRACITYMCLPYKAYIETKTIIKTIYRKYVSKQKLLEWTTSEEAEIQSKTNIFYQYNQMWVNVLIGIVAIGIGIAIRKISMNITGIIWILTPIVMWYISQEIKKEEPITKLNKEEIKYLEQIGKNTWKFFEKYINEENNYLITDNYQEDRKEKIVSRTSSTNIGLSILSIISAYDLKHIELEKALILIQKIIENVESLQKWNGHLYNWYSTKTKEPLIPQYISTVDSGNFVGYLYVTKTFLEKINKKTEIKNKEEITQTIKKIENIIKNTDFSKLYNEEQQIFSIGFNVEENKLTDSYYDLLASEARQASLVAIAKKDVPAKHWNFLSRTLTKLGKYKGLISWSGTAFEYLMPDVNIPRYEGSLLDESSRFLIKSQIEYANKLNLPWGISESAFNLKDLQTNYQYKAFGIPWLGLKRGLADEMVISSYGGILAINDVPKEVIENLKRLEKQGMNGQYGFYESIDYTPQRGEKGKTSSVVKTYMAHHQGLILLSINNLFNNNILVKRFMENPEIEAVSILLQETMPETAIITKEEKEKIEKLKYKDYEEHTKKTYKKIDERIITGNVISNENYVVAVNQKGQGFSKYKDIYINRHKKTDDYAQGIFFNIKNIKTKNIWSSNYSHNQNKENQYQISFTPDKTMQEIINGNIKTKIKNTVMSNEPVEIRRITLENMGNSEEILEITSYFEPVLSKKEQDYAHKAFNNLFLITKYDEETNSLIVKRRNRIPNKEEIQMAVNLSTNSEKIGDLEYEIDQEKFIGQGNLEIPQMVKNSNPLSKKIGLVTEPIIAMKRTVKVEPGKKAILDLIISVGEDEKEIKENIKKYQSNENVKKEIELSKARVEAESRYLRLKGSEIEIYQKMLSYLIFENPVKSKKMQVSKRTEIYKQSQLWKYGISGDLPIILVKIKNVNDGYVVKEILKAYEFFRTKNIQTEIVIIDEEKHSYENYVREEIEGAILNSQMSYLKNSNGGIFVLSKNEIDKKDIEQLEFLSEILIDTSKGGLENNIKEIEEKYLEEYETIGNEVQSIQIEEEANDDIDILENKENLKYYNEYGGFSSDGKEYLIKTNKENRLPTVWSHMMTNDKFGSIITQNMGGYSWYKNSRLDRITAWANNPSLDIPSEVIYLKNKENQKTWSLGLNPMPDNKNYNIVYGFGYCKYIHKSEGIEQTLEMFVPREDACKIGILNLKNTTPNKKKLKLYYYIKPVMGEDEIKTDTYIDLNFDKNNNVLHAKNMYKEEIEKTQIYISSSQNIKSYTGNKSFFLGNTGLSDPEGIKKVSLNNQNSLGNKSCIAYEIEIELESFENKELSIILGADENLIDCKNTAYKYQKLQNCKEELNKVKEYWEEFLGRLQIYTPLESINILLNGWISYQIINSRLAGRSGYYQSGGAFGFRDQLQDTIGLKYLDTNILKDQIVKHSKHQFIEGDVEHWWHEETKRGIRTRFSDDLLWLPYCVIEYIEFTGDTSILEIQTPFLEGNMLEENQDEKYDKYKISNQEGSVYEHCIKAIEKSLDFGENNLPKIGSGDWNDGFSTVGNKGKGESVWLGFFLYNILDKFVVISKEKEDIELSSKYENIKNELKRALNTNGWDGRWYKRAFMDNGKTLGSMENDECRIDSIAQSWSIISNAGDNDKKYISMQMLENHLIDRENGIIKLLDPPFEKGKLEPRIY